MAQVKICVSVRSLELNGVLLGVELEEKNKPTIVSIDAHCQVQSVSSDELCDTVDYTKISAAAEKVALARRFNLVETMASEICVALLRLSPRVQRVTVCVRKPRALANGVAEITASARQTSVLSDKDVE